MVHCTSISLDTKGHTDIHDVTGPVVRAVSASGIRDGIVCIANAGSTAGITTVEFEPGALADLTAALERLAPQQAHYAHDATWHDGNGFAHLRSALVGASCSFPVAAGRPVLGTWQQVVFIDFDNRPRKRELAIVVVGE